MASGTIVAYLFVNHFTRIESIILVLSVLGVHLLGDLARLFSPALNKIVLKIMGPLMRDEEEFKLSAQLFYIMGLSCAALFFPKPIAVQAILTLAWLDPIASLYGTKFGKITWKRALHTPFPHLTTIPDRVGAKTIEGSAVGFIAAILAGIVAWTGPWAAYRAPSGLIWPGAAEVVIFSLSGAFAATLAEAWASQWDDNINIPFWTGFIVWAVALIIGYPSVFS